jgi:hypothetical protein
VLPEYSCEEPKSWACADLAHVDVHRDRIDIGCEFWPSRAVEEEGCVLDSLRSFLLVAGYFNFKLADDK